MGRGVVIGPPPTPLDPATTTLDTGEQIYRVFTASPGRTAVTFNPGFGAPSRFAFFGDPAVPVLYAAATEEAAVTETLLHDIPATGGLLPYDAYARTVMVRLTVTRPLRLAVFHGLGLRTLRVTAEDLTASAATAYPHTVRWAQAAHDAGFDGVVWMSRLCNDSRAYVFFGDRCEKSLAQDVAFGRLFATGTDQLWLIDLCAPLHVDVLLGS